MQYYRGELARKPHPEGVPQGLFPGAAGHTLPGCRTGAVTIPSWFGHTFILKYGLKCPVYMFAHRGIFSRKV